ncbi:flagellar biosynthesis anti-sigma factor FlgM [Ramlibacter sp.]|uniref:flagellar biosynthesis anti-sigma factor FlgM n=1 Tax=Ramlibacter sp. TaxID=1917967 RepID=UPI002B81CC21|nr:flagellar biosynthesis anti-sigma factor FlgM [Ramlibacter sp.]HWI82109.1 flagellar biosynthesis anti-sigma factor FlgM [Ramlibacter sp.]
MKIDPTTGSATPLRLPTRSRAGAPPAPAPAAGTAAGTAGGTAGAGNVRAFPEPADGAFDAAKVAAIREEIRAGRYRVDPERIADGMLASLRELLPEQRG